MNEKEIIEFFTKNEIELPEDLSRIIRERVKSAGVLEESTPEEAVEDAMVDHREANTDVISNAQEDIQNKPVSEIVNDSVSETVNDSVSETVSIIDKQPPDELVEESANKTTGEAVKELVEEFAGEPVEEPAGEAVKELAEEPASEPDIELIKEPFNEPVDEAFLEKAKQIGFEFVDVRKYESVDKKVTKLINEDFALKYFLMPLEINNGALHVAMHDPTDFFLVDDLKLLTSMKIQPLLGDIQEIKKLIERTYTQKPVAANGYDPTPIDESKTKSAPYNSKKVHARKGKIGTILLESGLIDEETLGKALEIQKQTGQKIGEILVQEGYIERNTFYTFLEKQTGFAHADLENLDVPHDIVTLVDERFARTNCLVPYEKTETHLMVAMQDPYDVFVLDDLRLISKLEIIPFLADPAMIHAILDKHFEKKKEHVKSQGKKKEEKASKERNYDDEIKKLNEEIHVEFEDIEKEDTGLVLTDVDNAPVVKLVNLILSNAVLKGASDVHIEPYEDVILIRFRIDGHLVEVMKQDIKVLPLLVARIKIISGLNIAEKRIPQDGRISMKINEAACDLRVSLLPTIFGEKIVIRISDKEGFNVSKEQLGLFEDDSKKFDQILSNPHGIVLVTGPTGSGKSTTLYVALKELCKPDVNIVSVEDPVEAVIRGVNQVQVNVKAGLTFATALRSFLRQDPDIITVGEIRDGETAEIAMRSAITGHLVLSTLHTNDSASAISRMVDMGVASYLISAAVVGVIAQRLVRRLCSKCKAEHVLSPEDMGVLEIDASNDLKIYKAVGCDECNHIGYKGRIAVYEIMTINNELRDMISKNASSDQLKEKARELGMNTLAISCVRLVKEGVTSMDELFNVALVKE